MAQHQELEESLSESLFRVNAVIGVLVQQTSLGKAYTGQSRCLTPRTVTKALAAKWRLIMIPTFVGMSGAATNILTSQHHNINISMEENQRNGTS